RTVALRSKVIDGLPAPLLHHAAGNVAGRNDGIIDFARAMQPLELARDLLARAGRVCDEDDRSALGPRPHQRVASVRMDRKAVVHDAPYIAQEHVVAGCERGKLRDQRGRYGTHPKPSSRPRRSGTAAAVKRAYRMKRKERKSAGRQQGAWALVNARFCRVSRHAMQRLRAHRARWREQEALPEPDVVVENVDDRRFGLDPL